MSRHRHPHDTHFGLLTALRALTADPIGFFPTGTSVEDVLRYLYEQVLVLEGSERAFARFFIDAVMSTGVPVTPFWADVVTRTITSGLGDAEPDDALYGAFTWYPIHYPSGSRYWTPDDASWRVDSPAGGRPNNLRRQTNTGTRGAMGFPLIHRGEVEIEWYQRTVSSVAYPRVVSLQVQPMSYSSGYLRFSSGASGTNYTFTIGDASGGGFVKAIPADTTCRVRASFDAPGETVGVKVWLPDTESMPEDWDTTGLALDPYDGTFEDFEHEALRMSNAASAVTTLGGITYIKLYKYDFDEWVNTRLMWLDAVIKKVQSFTRTIDAIVRVKQNASITADSIIKKTISASLTSDAIIFKTVESGVLIDAYIETSIFGGMTVDAVVKKSQSGSMTIDAYLTDATISAIGEIVLGEYVLGG